MSLAQRAALRQQQPRQLRQTSGRRVFPLIIVMVLLAALVIAVAGFEYVYRDRIYPNVKVSVSGALINVGGESQSGVVALLAPYRVRSLFRLVTLTAQRAAPVSFQAYQLGYTMDRGLTAANAYDVGHAGSLLHRANSQVNLLANGSVVAVVQHVNRNVLLGRLFTLAGRMNRPAKPGVAGRRMNVALAARRISRQLVTEPGSFTAALPFTSIRALPVPHPAKHKRASVKKKKPASKH